MSTTATITTDVVTSQDPSFTAIIKELRDRSLRPRKVRALVGDLTAKLATLAIETPAPDEKVAVIVILRSGLVMAEPFLSQLPETADTVIYHLGLFREKQTLQPVEYYNKLPAKSPRIRHAYVLDPVLATGGTAEAAVAILKDWGIEKVTFICALASQAGLERAESVWPEGVRFVVGAVDPELDGHGYVKPGFGDIGDRLFGTSDE